MHRGADESIACIVCVCITACEIVYNFAKYGLATLILPLSYVFHKLCFLLLLICVCVCVCVFPHVQNRKAVVLQKGTSDC